MKSRQLGFRPIFRILLLALGAAGLSACDTFKKDEQALIQSAQQYIEQRDVRAAAIELQNALQINPGNAEARFLFARINLQVGSANVAENEFRRAQKFGAPIEAVALGLARAILEQDQYQRVLDEVRIGDDWSVPTRASLLGVRASAHAALGDLAAAMEGVRSAQTLQKDNLYALIAETQVLIAEKRFAAASDILARAHSIDPANQEVLFLSAAVAYETGDREALKRDLVMALDADIPKIVTPYEWRARLALARLHMEDGTLDQAQAFLGPLMSKLQGDADSLYLAAMLAFKMSEYELAGRRLHKVLELKPDHRPALLLLGSVNYILGEYEQAAYFLAKYVATVPEDTPARKLLGQAYLELEAHRELTEVLQPLIADQRGDAEVVAMVGMSAMRTGQLQEGVAEIEKAVAMAPDNTKLREYLARAYIIAGEPDRAIEELETVLTVGETGKRAEVLLILAHLRSGDMVKATGVATDLARANPNDPRLLTIAGNVFLVSGDIDAALRHLYSALQLDVDYLPAQMAVARAYENRGEFDRARTAYEELIEAGSGKLLPMLALAKLEESQGNQEQMLYWLNEAAALQPPELAPRILLANYQLTRGRADIAAQLVQEALKLDPGNITVQLLQARTLMADGAYSQALPVLKEMAASRPQSVAVAVLMAEAYLRTGRLEETIAAAERILAGQPDNIPATMLMAAARLRAGRHAQALEHADRLVALKPEWHKGYEVRGDVQMAMGDAVAAERAYRRAIALNPADESLLKLVQVYIQTDQLPLAETELTEWMEKQGRDGRLLLSLGIVYQRHDKIDMAISTYQQVLETDPDNAVALNNLAGLFDMRDDPRALAYAERAYRSNTAEPSIQDTYGWLLTRNGDPVEGKRLLGKALEKLPGNPDVGYHLSVALLQTGEEARAKALLKQLLEADKDFDSRKEAAELYDKIK